MHQFKCSLDHHQLLPCQLLNLLSLHYALLKAPRLSPVWDSLLKTSLLVIAMTTKVATNLCVETIKWKANQCTMIVHRLHDLPLAFSSNLVMWNIQQDCTVHVSYWYEPCVIC